MSGTNLLNLDVDTLFEQHGVSEIDIVHKKIQEEAENKREELRTMVGESYRDLLKAADTIISMRESSDELITFVDAVAESCRHLNEQQLIGFKTEPDLVAELQTRNANKQMNNYFSTMVQIKLLTMLPELIWTNLDMEHYYAATELFIFSRHISTGLQLNVDNPLMQRLPVVRKQWEILKPFHTIIKQQVMSALECEDLSAEVAVDCVLALLQLERCPLENVLKAFLQLRCGAFLNCLASESGRVKERILNSLKVLNDSVELMADCFSERGLLFEKLAEFSDPEAPPTVTQISSEDMPFVHVLPDIIRNFKPKFDAVVLVNESVHEVLEQWLSDTERIAGVQLQQLFELVSAMHVVQEIKTEAKALRKRTNLGPLMVQYNLTQSLDFFELRYVPLINERIHNIISDSWSKAMDGMLVALQRGLSQEDTEPSKLSTTLWQESPGDLPSSLAQALSEDYTVKRLLMKSKGYDEGIVKICTEFDKKLADIVGEMNVLLEEPSTKLDDKLALVDFLRETAQLQLTEFITKVKGLFLQRSDRRALLFVVRLCCAFVELCSHLKICFCQKSSWRHLLGTSTASSSEYWQRMCGLLEEETLLFWHRIIDGLLQEFSCAKHLSEAVTYDVILADFAHWETVMLDQTDEQGVPVHSTFRIPTQPRISLQTYFQALIGSLSNIVPQTLPANVLKVFNQKLLQQLLSHYETLNRNLSQNVALQLYFDLRFLQNSFDIGREQRDDFTKLQNVFKENIDPFDFELFSTHIIANVKRAVVRFHCLLGVLTPSTAAQQTGQQTATTPSFTQEKDPNVLSLSSSGSTSLWFPLLPIVNVDFNPSATPSDGRKPNTGETEKATSTRKTTVAPATVSTRKSDTAKAKSGAASFFGVMPQEWFR